MGGNKTLQMESIQAELISSYLKLENYKRPCRIPAKIRQTRVLVPMPTPKPAV